MLSRFGTITECIWDALQQSRQSPELSPSDFFANSDIISKDETDSGRPSEGITSKKSNGALTWLTDGADACCTTDFALPETKLSAPSFPHSRCAAPISAKCAWEAMRKDELYCPHCLGTFRRLEGLMEHVRTFKPCRDKWDGDCVMIGCDTCHKKVKGGVALVLHEYQEHYNPAFGFECPGCHESENRFRSVLRHIECPDGQFDCGNCRAYSDRYSCPDCSFTCVGRLQLFVHKQECEASPPGHRRMGMLGQKFPTIFKGWCAHCGARFACDLDEWRHHQASPECFEACSSEPATLQCVSCSDGALYNSSQFWAHLWGSDSCAIYFGGRMNPMRAITIARVYSIGDLPNGSVRKAPLLPQPMQALWTALVGKKHIDEAMGIVCDQLERRSHRDEGWMGRRFAVGIDSGATPIILASLASRPDVVAALIIRGADVGATTDSDVGRFTALHAASATGDCSSIHLLVEAGADLEARDEHGCTPLFYAAREGRYDAVEVLVGRMADVNALDSRGNTPLHAAAVGTHSRSIELLVAAGARADVANRGRHTALWLAVNNSLWRSVRHLVRAGADVAFKDSCGRSLLIIAVGGYDQKMVAELIAAGANVNDRDRSGWPAVAVAVKQVNMKIAAALISAGASLRTFRLAKDPSRSRSILKEAVETYNALKKTCKTAKPHRSTMGPKYRERHGLVRLLQAEGCK